MRPAARTIGFMASVAAALASGCLSAGRFPCESDAPCVSGGAQGRCEQESCAFADGQCASGWRWDDTAAPEQAGQCVPSEGADLASPGRRDLAMPAPPRDLAVPDLAVPDLTRVDLVVPPSCSISNQTCPNGWKCVPFMQGPNDTGTCIEAGDGGAGAPCITPTRNDGCAPGFMCNADEIFDNKDYCERICDFGTIPCPQGSYCTGWASENGNVITSTCLPGCDLFANPPACTIQPEIGSGTGTCQFFDGSGPLCVPVGDQTTGSQCDIGQCVPGDACIWVGGARRCVQLCDTKAVTPGCTCQSLQFDAISNLGYCPLPEAADGGGGVGVVDAGVADH